jgi:two-component system OmpR family response regulator
MRLLLAEDDAILADALSANLRSAGFEVEVAENGAVAEYLLVKHHFDLGVIDIGLPMVDGLTVLKRAHAARPTLPLMVLTALDSLDSRVAGLNAGADDYLTKPFDFPELEARIRALLRRTRLTAAAVSTGIGTGIGTGISTNTGANTGATAPMRNPVQVSGKLSFDRDGRRLTVAGEVVDLSPREWLLLDALLTQEGKVVTKDHIAQIWSGDASEPGTPSGSLEVLMHRLRRKLEGSGVNIRTVRGLGYLLEHA